MDTDPRTDQADGILARDQVGDHSIRITQVTANKRGHVAKVDCIVADGEDWDVCISALITVPYGSAVLWAERFIKLHNDTFGDAT